MPTDISVCPVVGIVRLPTVSNIRIDMFQCPWTAIKFSLDGINKNIKTCTLLGFCPSRPARPAIGRAK